MLHIHNLLNLSLDLPAIAIGSSETGAQASNPSNKDSGVSTGDFKPGPGACVVSADLSRVLAGPFAGRMLCDLGAEVVKLEPPEGDVTRGWGRMRHGLSGYYTQQNSGKRSVCDR